MKEIFIVEEYNLFKDQSTLKAAYRALTNAEKAKEYLEKRADTGVTFYINQMLVQDSFNESLMNMSNEAKYVLS